MPLTLNLLLENVGIDPKQTVVFLHTPGEEKARRVLPWLAAERPDLFDAYQSNHPQRVEATVLRRQWAVSFVAITDKRLVFVGLYRKEDSVFHTYAELRRIPVFAEMMQSIRADPFPNDSENGRTIFDFRKDERLAELAGRMIVRAPVGRAYARLAENLELPVLALRETPELVASPPNWREFNLTAEEVRNLPRSWRARIAEWRGVYLIVDESDGSRYVGSASGAENLFGRWLAHVKGEHGVTSELQFRKTEKFRFSILERVSPDLETREIVAVENSWKRRLHTVEWGLNTA